MYIENSSNLLLHFLLKYLVNPCYISAHSVDQLFFFNSRSYKIELNSCLIIKYTCFINTQIKIN